MKIQIVKIEQNLSTSSVNIMVEHDAEILITKSWIIENLFIFVCSGSKVQIGSGVSCKSIVGLLQHEPKSMTIGLASFIEDATDITVGGMHIVIDVLSNTRLNYAKDVQIGDRVWIGENCTISKRPNLGSECVIGTKSVVAGEILSNPLEVGLLASVIHSSVRRDRSLIK